jgi:hypothetical protein
MVAGGFTILAPGAAVFVRLALVGATAAVATTGADRIAFAFTAMAADLTGCALANALCCMATTAPGAPRFTYCTFVTLTLTLLFTITVLVIFTRFR